MAWWYHTLWRIYLSLRRLPIRSAKITHFLYHSNIRHIKGCNFMIYVVGEKIWILYVSFYKYVFNDIIYLSTFNILCLYALISRSIQKIIVIQNAHMSIKSLMHFFVKIWSWKYKRNFWIVLTCEDYNKKSLLQNIFILPGSFYVNLLQLLLITLYIWWQIPRYGVIKMIYHKVLETISKYHVWNFHYYLPDQLH